MIKMLRMTPHSVQTPADITMPAAKPRLTTAVEAVILAKRMREVLTGIVIRGLDPRIHLQKEEPSQGMNCQIKPGNDEFISHVPRGFTRRVGIALAGSSGQGCRG
jgi:hypothetical protein